MVRPQLTLHVASHGPVDGRLVVFLHGFPEFWWSWRHQLRALGDAGFLAVAPDLRGYGDSDKPDPRRGGYDIATLAEDIALLITTLHSERGHAESAIVVAHDWGGAIAWALAAMHPQVVQRLVILNAPHPLAFRRSLWRHPSQLFKSWYMLMFQIPGLTERWIAKDPVTAMARSFLGAAGKRSAFARGDFAVYGERIGRPGVAQAALAYYRSIPKFLALTDPLARPIECPVLTLWGRKDPALGDFLAPDAQRWCSGPFEVRYFADAGHWLQQEEPEAVNAALLEFLG